MQSITCSLPRRHSVGRSLRSRLGQWRRSAIPSAVPFRWTRSDRSRLTQPHPDRIRLHSTDWHPLATEGGAGERAGNRTPNLVIKSHLLCQLSYAPGRTVEGPAPWIKSPGRSDLRSRAPRHPASRSRARRPPRARPRRAPPDVSGSLRPARRTRFRPACARATALQPEGSPYPTLGQQRYGHRPRESIAPHDALPPRRRPAPARADAKSELEQTDGEARARGSPDR